MQLPIVDLEGGVVRITPGENNVPQEVFEILGYEPPILNGPTTATEIANEIYESMQERLIEDLESYGEVYLELLKEHADRLADDYTPEPTMTPEERQELSIAYKEAVEVCALRDLQIAKEHRNTAPLEFGTDRNLESDDPLARNTPM